MKPRRSIISVPGNIEKMHIKSASLSPDVIMLDLEDSVNNDEKVNAREQIINSLHNIDFGNKTVTFRMNSCDTYFAYEDIISVLENAGEKIDSVVVPKVNSEKDIHFVDSLINAIELKKNLSNRIRIEASIETAEGMQNIEKIAKASDRIISLVFGIADYTASIGAKNSSISGHGENEESIYPGHRWNFALSRIVMTAKANNLIAIDAPYGNFKDSEGLKKACMISRSLGLDGKWAIHPAQIDTINEMFTPDKDEIELAKKIIDAHKKAVQNGRGSVALEGRMIDNATIRLAKRTNDMATFLGL